MVKCHNGAMRCLLAGLYIVGAALTILAVLHAYYRARREKTRLDAIKVRSDAHNEPSLVEQFEADLSDNPQGVQSSTVAAANEEELNRLLAAANIDDPPPTFKDMRLPLSYWNRRQALTDTLLQFKVDGLVALLGVVISTIASVWSLFI